MRLHRADLHRRRVRAEHHLLGLAELHVERVLHRAAQGARAHVERLEVVPVVLDLGAFHHEVAHAHEDVLELTLHLRDEMQVAARSPVTAEGEVEARPSAQTRPRPAASSARLASTRPATARLERADRLPDGRALPGVEVLDRLVHLAIGEPRPVSARRR